VTHPVDPSAPVAATDDPEAVDVPPPPPRPVRAWTRETAQARVAELRRVLPAAVDDDEDRRPPVAGEVRVDATWHGGTVVRAWCGVDQGFGATEAEALSRMVDAVEEAALWYAGQLEHVAERSRREAARCTAQAKGAAARRANLLALLGRAT
jgi:hypothetical protein